MAKHNQEIDILTSELARRFCIKPKPVRRWLEAHNVKTIRDLRNLWPDAPHAETMQRALDGIWDLQMQGCFI